MRKGSSKLEGQEDNIIEMILNGSTYRDIAQHYSVGVNTVHNFLHSEHFAARATEARRRVASTYAELAEEALKEIKKGDDSALITRQRELAHHYRWRAAKASPREFGDKVDITSGNERISINIQASSQDDIDAVNAIGDED